MVIIYRFNIKENYLIFGTKFGINIFAKYHKMKLTISMFLNDYIFKNSLKQIDYLYKNIILTLPIESRINYCKSLVYRSKEDLKNCTCNRKRKEMKKVLNAALRELETLNLR